MSLKGQCLQDTFGDSHANLQLNPKRYYRKSAKFLPTNFTVELSGENFWRANICNDNLDEPPPYFTKGAFFYRTDLVEIVSSLPIDLLCFSTFNIYFDNILKFQQKNLCFGKYEYGNYSVIQRINIDFCNNGSVTVHK